MIWAGGKGSQAGRALGVAILVAASLLVPVFASPALAAEPDLATVSTSVYTLIPDKGVVHVIVDVTATNNKPNLIQTTPTGTRTTRYFYESASIAVQSEATGIRAASGRKKLTTSVKARDTFQVVKVGFPRDVYYKESTTVRVEYDLPGGAPRSDSDIRVGAAFATFYVWAFGDSGDVRIVIPAGYKVETQGAAVAESVANGITTLSASDVSDTSEWYAVIVADRHEALTTERLDLPDGEHLVVRGWPEDEEWRTRVRDLLRIGLPVLVEKIGLDWPVKGDIEVAEVHTPLLEGYAGVFYTLEDRIEISEDLDELTIVHEASHAWFNQDLFVGRWIGEGLADEYASRVLDEVSVGGLGPDRVTPTSDGAVDLNTWVHPGRIADEETNTREHFGYEASWTVVRALIDEIGEDGMRKVLAAARAKATAYPGAGAPETVTIATDWRRFLDLLEGPGGSTKADALFRRWVIEDDQVRLLDARADARESFRALVDEGAGWKPGYVVRGPMDRWQFSSAADRIHEATAILAVRDQIAEIATGLGVTPPASLRSAYEGATDDLESVQGLATAQLAAVTELAAAAADVVAEPDIFASIGLIGETPRVALTAATESFASGDIDATNAGAAEVRALMASVGDTGRTRALVGGVAGTGVVVLAIGGVIVARRRRSPVAVVAVGAEVVAETAAATPDPAPESPPTVPDDTAPYATLGGPRSADPIAEDPAEPRPPGGDDQ